MSLDLEIEAHLERLKKERPLRIAAYVNATNVEENKPCALAVNLAGKLAERYLNPKGKERLAPRIEHSVDQAYDRERWAAHEYAAFSLALPDEEMTRLLLRFQLLANATKKLDYDSFQEEYRKVLRYAKVERHDVKIYGSWEPMKDLHKMKSTIVERLEELSTALATIQVVVPSTYTAFQATKELYRA